MTTPTMSVETLIAALALAETRARIAEASEERARIAGNAAEERARIAEEHPERAKMRKEIARLRRIQRANGGEIYYPNQKETATNVCQCIHDVAIVFQMVLAPCQSGKTGCMLAIIEELLESNSNINPEKIFVITGLSDKEWVRQTRLRIPLGTNVIHRSQLNRSNHLFEDLKNAVILVDECQIATKQMMSIDKLLHSMGLKDHKYLKENNVNIVEFSATPNNSLDDVELWTTSSAKHTMEPGRGYKGHRALIDDKRLYQAYDLYIQDDVHAGLSQEDIVARHALIKPAIDEIHRLKKKIDEYGEPRFHVIRVPSGHKGVTVMGRIKAEFNWNHDQFKDCFVDNDNLGEDKRLIDELKCVPQKQTVLFIKQTARCAATFPNKNRIGVLYEHLPIIVQDDIIAQGLAGRACGYDVDDGMVVFSNVESIQKYVDMVESGFTERTVFTFLGHKNKKATHLRPSGYTNVAGAAEVEEITQNQEPVIKKCASIEEAKKYIKTRWSGKRGPQAKRWEEKKDENGFYKSTSGKGNDKTRTRVRSTHEIYAIRNWNLDDTHTYAFHPCYENVNDINTLQWWVIHR